MTTVSFRLHVQIMHHTGSWTELMCISSRITDPYEHPPNEVWNGFKTHFFAAEWLRILCHSQFCLSVPLSVVFPLFGLKIRVEQPILSVYLIAMSLLMSLNYSVYIYVSPADGDENGSAPAKSGKKKNCTNPRELFSSCVTHHSALWTFALWTSGITHHTPWTCGQNDTVLGLISLFCENQPGLWNDLLRPPHGQIMLFPPLVASPRRLMQMSMIIFGELPPQ